MMVPYNNPKNKFKITINHVEIATITAIQDHVIKASICTKI